MERVILKKTTVDAGVAEVWDAWTTPGGAKTFFAPEARLTLSIGGPYELLFDQEQEPGKQGSEGCRVLSYLPHQMLSFDWNAPPLFPAIREQRTWVVVQLAEVGEKTEVRLTHLGWREGEEWDQVYRYFDRAWGVVLGRLAHRFAQGPIDWTDPFTP